MLTILYILCSLQYAGYHCAFQGFLSEKTNTNFIHKTFRVKRDHLGILKCKYQGEGFLQHRSLRVTIWKLKNKSCTLTLSSILKFKKICQEQKDSTQSACAICTLWTGSILIALPRWSNFVWWVINMTCLSKLDHHRSVKRINLGKTALNARAD